MSMKRAFAVLQICVFFSLLVSTSTFAAPPSTIDPCAVITQKEAEDIMKEQMKAGKAREQKATGMKMCLYEAADDQSFSMLQISVIQGESAKETFLMIKNNFPDHEKITGLGDDTFIATPGIHILKGGIYLTIAAGNLNRSRDKLLVAGEKAVTKLEKELK